LNANYSFFVKRKKKDYANLVEGAGVAHVGSHPKRVGSKPPIGTPLTIWVIAHRIKIHCIILPKENSSLISTSKYFCLHVHSIIYIFWGRGNEKQNKEE
jgi:hypothetical protein